MLIIIGSVIAMFLGCLILGVAYLVSVLADYYQDNDEEE